MQNTRQNLKLYILRDKTWKTVILSESPEVDSYTIEDNIIKIKFRYAGNGLHLQGEKLNGLQVLVDVKDINDFNTDIQGDIIYINISNEFKKGKIEIRFAWKGYVEVNLYNSAGIPAKPFLLTL